MPWIFGPEFASHPGTVEMKEFKTLSEVERAAAFKARIDSFFFKQVTRWPSCRSSTVSAAHSGLYLRTWLEWDRVAVRPHSEFNISLKGRLNLLPQSQRQDCCSRW
jgi:hypothetical protein